MVLKVWRLPHSKDGKGHFDTIMAIMGKKGNIMDLEEGRDLSISLTRNKQKGYVNVSAIMAEDKSPLIEGVDISALRTKMKSDDFSEDSLTESEKLFKDIVYDKRMAKDFYKYPEQERLRIIAEGGIARRNNDG